MVVNFREPNEFGEGATMMTRNVNEPLPDHYGTDDWENTDTLTSHLHGDGEAVARLLPCPFCGGEATGARSAGSAWFTHAAHADDCNIADFQRTEAEAIAAWNRRSEPSEPAAVTDEMVEAACESYNMAWKTRPDHERKASRLAMRFALTAALQVKP